MNVVITGDSSSDSGVGEIVLAISHPARIFFRERDYGKGVAGLCIVVVCQRDDLKLKQQVVWDRKEKTLYIDLPFNLAEMRVLARGDRYNNILKGIMTAVPLILSSRRVIDFNSKQFEADLMQWIEKQTKITF